MFGGGDRGPWRCFVATCAATACFGCSGDDHPPPLSDPTNLECNIRDPACQQTIFDATAAVRGQDGAAMPSVRTITLTQLEAELRSGELGDGAATEGPWGAALTALGLLDPGVTLEEASIEDALASIAAFYDPRAGGVTVIDREEPSDPMDDLFVLSHEFVHALQDASVGLIAFQDTWVTGTDSLVATKALMEGEAVVLGNVVAAESAGASPASLDWAGYADGLWQVIFASAEASLAPFLAATTSLPYALGTSRLWPLWLYGGQPAIDALYANPHASVVDWATGMDAGWAPTLVEPLDCYPTSAPDAYVAWDRDSFGVTGAFALRVEYGIPAELAWETSLAWRGDEAVVFRPDGAGPDVLEVAVAWRTRWATTTDAEDFARIASTLSTGMVVTSMGREVLLWGTTAPEVAASWSGVADCGTVADLPEGPVDGASPSSTRFARFTGRLAPAIGLPSWRRRVPADR